MNTLTHKCEGRYYPYSTLRDVLPTAQDDALLVDAIEAVHAILGSGKSGTCPCCNQTVKVYKRSLTSSMGRWLIWLVRSFGQTREWVDIKGSPVRGGDYAKFLHWGMAKQSRYEDGGKKNSGLWKPTLRGGKFVRKLLVVPSYALVYNNTPVGWSDVAIDIVDALKKKFSYKELMGR